MPTITIVFGAILTALGLHLYFNSATAEPSVTALLPAFLGAPLFVCGLIARKDAWRMHAMHVAVLLGLLGAIAALGRMAMKASTLLPSLISDDPVTHRPVRGVFLMGLVCIIYVVLCVRSFIQARRRREAGEASNLVREDSAMNWKIAFIFVGLLAIIFMSHQFAPAADGISWEKTTYVYKTVGPTKIEADVYRRNGVEPRPAVVWIHGGALIMGNRGGIEKNIVELCREQNYVLISIDYRLAPEVKLPAIIEDVKDAFRWIRSEGPAKFYLDPAKMLVAGGSAGGYLTMMTGICIEPRPTALVAYWGYGDVDGPWYVEPSEFYRKSPLVSREDAFHAVDKEVQTSGEGRARGAFYLYCRQNGLWTREVTGFDPKSERQKLDPYCPVRNITSRYPPILMIHGTADTDVPYQESADMDAALSKQGLPHELITVEGGGHGLGDKSNPAVINAHARAAEFIRKQLD